eukprot:9143776-Lingulodinium_polyedra.AAC.1
MPDGLAQAVGDVATHGPTELLRVCGSQGSAREAAGSRALQLPMRGQARAAARGPRHPKRGDEPCWLLDKFA